MGSAPHESVGNHGNHLTGLGWWLLVTCIAWWSLNLWDHLGHEMHAFVSRHRYACAGTAAMLLAIASASSVVGPHTTICDGTRSEHLGMQGGHNDLPAHRNCGCNATCVDAENSHWSSSTGLSPHVYTGRISQKKEKTTHKSDIKTATPPP